MERNRSKQIKSNTKQPSHSHSLQPLSEHRTIEGIPLLSFTGSMTVEAAIVLPLFLFFLLNLLSIIEIFNLHGTLLSALCEVGNELSVGAYAYDCFAEPEEADELEAFVGNLAFSYLYVKGRVEGIAGREYLAQSPLPKGAAGLVYLGSSVIQDETIDLRITYRAAPFIKLIGFQPGIFMSRYYGRAWTGYDVATEGEDGQTEYVYVAENAKVYHLSRSCTHIQLSIRECDAALVGNLQNMYGEKYLPCERCVTDGKGTLYITNAGNHYHQSLSCSGLKRTIRKIAREEAEKHYRMCSGCGD